MQVWLIEQKKKYFGVQKLDSKIITKTKKLKINSRVDKEEIKQKKPWLIF